MPSTSVGEKYRVAPKTAPKFFASLALALDS